MTGSRLRVLIDGEELAPEDARRMWELFSAHMDAHRGDFEGFAKSQGKASATTSTVGGAPTLVLSSQPLTAASPGGPSGGDVARRGSKRARRGRRKR
jgi:hypothetical protein